MTLTLFERNNEVYVVDIRACAKSSQLVHDPITLLAQISPSLRVAKSLEGTRSIITYRLPV